MNYPLQKFFWGFYERQDPRRRRLQIKKAFHGIPFPGTRGRLPFFGRSPATVQSEILKMRLRRGLFVKKPH
jgi:hypothetical protein